MSLLPKYAQVLVVGGAWIPDYGEILLHTVEPIEIKF